jgi:hypothetical protein
LITPPIGDIVEENYRKTVTFLIAVGLLTTFLAKYGFSLTGEVVGPSRKHPSGGAQTDEGMLCIIQR